ncbi:MAG: hypothetical protein A2Y23_10395, partial [Clostridiales bacterium GWB2_37_7]
FDIKQLTKINTSKLTKKVVDKKRFAVSVGAVALVFILIGYIFFSGVAYTVSMNGSVVGKVRSKKEIEALVLQMKEQFKKQYNAEIGVAGELVYTKTRAASKDLLNEEAIETFVKNDITYTIQSYSIVANGNDVAVLKSKEEAEKVLEQVKAAYVKPEDRAKYKEITFAETVEVKQEFNEAGKIMPVEEVAAFVLKGTNEEKIHKVTEGDSFWSISRKYNIKIEDLQKANPKADPNKIKIGQELSLVVPKPLLSVKTIEMAEYKENIPFEQTVEFSSSMYKDQTSIKVKGVYGEREVVADVVKINGIEDSRNILTEKVIKDPKTQILLKGTKELPPKKGTGTFSTPTRGAITSRFGIRWGRPHEGIDYAAPIGTPVYASDGGVVTWVGTRGNFGKLIIIDHGGGLETYYGHLSKYFVEKGDKVYKGEKIGAVGNTGRTTGPNLHFEIRKNGKPIDPMKYVK